MPPKVTQPSLETGAPDAPNSAAPAAPKTPGKISTFAKAANIRKFVKADNILNQIVTITGFTSDEGDFGKVYRIEVTLPNGTLATITSGSDPVMKVMDAIKAAEAFPVEGCFVRHGRVLELE